MAFQSVLDPMQKTLYQREYRILLDLLREARMTAGINQGELAARMEMTQSMVSKCERGERRLDVIELRSWCGVIGVPFREFIDQFERAAGQTTGRPGRTRKSRM